MADIAKRLQNRVDRLVEVIHTDTPAMARLDQLPWLILLARQKWIRQPQTWRPPRGSNRQKREDLARHLLVTFPVPSFLWGALDIRPNALARVPVEDEWAVSILASVGRGVSLRTLVGTPVLPIPLTRRMCHHFLRAKADTTPIAALRRAQVVGHGGSLCLAVALGKTRLGRLHGVRPETGEPFWDSVIAWLCRAGAGELHPRRLDGLLGWIEVQARDAAANRGHFSLRGRSMSALLADMDKFALRIKRTAGNHFPASGLRPLVGDPWSIREILTPGELHDEGEAMAHCAWSYRELLRNRKVAIWSLRRCGKRVATVEVALGTSRVVQARRKANRPCDPEALAVIEAWARSNDLAVDLGWR